MKEKYEKILELLENEGISIKDACKIVGITRNKLYKNITPKQKILMYRKKIVGIGKRTKEHLDYIENNNYINTMHPLSHLSYNY